MRRERVIFIALLSVLMATGCTDNSGNDTQEPVVPPQTPSIPVSNATLVTPVSDITHVAPDSNETAEISLEGKNFDLNIKDFSFKPNMVTV